MEAQPENAETQSALEARQIPVVSYCPATRQYVYTCPLLGTTRYAIDASLHVSNKFTVSFPILLALAKRRPDLLLYGDSEWAWYSEAVLFLVEKYNIRNEETRSDDIKRIVNDQYPQLANILLPDAFVSVPARTEWLHEMKHRHFIWFDWFIDIFGNE